MRLGYTILYVPDVERAVTFYEDAFGLDRRFVHESGQYAEMETGPTALAFAADALASSNFDADYRRADSAAPPAAFEITLVTDDVPKAFERAKEAGAAPLAEPTEKPWGQTVSYVRDLNGVIVELCTPVGG
ncbi:MAG: VOC family protein [Rhodothermaceae bacterium]|nr:VOC family protein [Rhodothermaceae bacterium]